MFGAVNFAASALFTNTDNITLVKFLRRREFAPLLEMKRHTGFGTLVTQLPRPDWAHGPRARATFSAAYHPIDASIFLACWAFKVAQEGEATTLKIHWPKHWLNRKAKTQPRKFRTKTAKLRTIPVDLRLVDHRNEKNDVAIGWAPVCWQHVGHISNALCDDEPL